MGVICTDNNAAHHVVGGMTADRLTALRLSGDMSRSFGNTRARGLDVRCTDRTGNIIEAVPANAR